MRLLHLFSVVLALPIVLASAAAETFTYAVAQHTSSFQVDGTITTGTNIGVLTFADISDFNLMLSAAGQSAVLTPLTTDNNGLYGDGLSATPDGLFFDFDTPDTIFFFGNTIAGNFLCFQTSGCDSTTGPNVSAQINGGSSLVEPQSGVVQIATYVPPMITPEPSSLLLLGTGLLSTTCFLRRPLR